MPKFEKGTSGNPKGRPRGIQDKRQALRLLLEENSEPLIRKAIEMALLGDPQSIRLLIERLIPKAKQDVITMPIQIDTLEKLTSITNLGHQLIQAVCDGELTPDEGRTVGSLLEIQRKIIETNELSERIEALEYTLKSRKKEVKK